MSYYFYNSSLFKAFQQLNVDWCLYTCLLGIIISGLLKLTVGTDNSRKYFVDNGFVFIPAIAAIAAAVWRRENDYPSVFASLCGAGPACRLFVF